MWSQDSWVETCNRLLEDIWVDLIFTGLREDRDVIQILMARLKDSSRTFNFAGDLTLVDQLCLLREVDLLVSVESGMTHLAAWITTPKVILFGPDYLAIDSSPAMRSTSLWLGLLCGPCVSSEAGELANCTDNQCMKQLTPDLVYRACITMQTQRRVEPSEKLRVA